MESKKIESASPEESPTQAQWDALKAYQTAKYFWRTSDPIPWPSDFGLTNEQVYSMERMATP